jgi:diguanylate cyclase (GGDEF)-like protein
MVSDHDDDNLDKTSIVPSDTFKMKMEKVDEAPPSLVLLMGPINQIGKQWQIGEKALIIGRSIESDICIDDRSVSRSHAQVVLEDGKVYVEDIGSSNGTEVAGEKLEKGNRVLLADNMQVKTGNVIFKYLEKGNIEAVSNQASYNRAQIDGLTQIYNKRAFLDKMEETFKRAKLMSIPLCLVVFDLDKFKNVNDTYGHRAGDFVLSEISGLIKKQLRPGDFFARYGGEEFTLLLGGTDLKMAVEVADRIRMLVEKHEFVFEGTELPVTISMGVAEITDEIENWEQLFELSDKALYKSKEDGRNRVSHLQPIP